MAIQSTVPPDRCGGIPGSDGVTGDDQACVGPPQLGLALRVVAFHQLALGLLL